MSDNPHFSSSDRISAESDSLKLGRQKSSTAAPKPKPKPKPRKPPPDEDTVLKNFNDMLDRVVIDGEPVTSSDNIADEKQPVTDNVACMKAVESPVHMESETSDYRSDSRGSIDDDAMHTACSVSNENTESVKETCVRGDHNGREV